jgi:anti-sigma28 factor (negative regulator of flagellin synthesis)
MINHVNNGLNLSKVYSQNANNNANAADKQKQPTQTKTEKMDDSSHLSKVETIKSQIEAGTYAIDLDATARKMAEALS